MTDTPEGPGLTVIEGDAEGAKKRKKRDAKSKVSGEEELKYTQSEINERVVMLMHGQGVAGLQADPGPFQDSFVTVRPDHGSGVLYGKIDCHATNTLSPVTAIDIKHAIIRWKATQAPHVQEFRNVGVKQAADIVELWEAMTPPIDADIVGENYQDVHPSKAHRMAWYRPSWRRTPGQVRLDQIPVWAELRSRMSCPDEVEGWIGGLFDSSSSNQQYLYLYGEGGNGKSAIVLMLAKMLGSAFAAVSADQDTFWTSVIPGHRLISFGDFAKTGFLTGATFKGLTGDGLIALKRKYKDAGTARNQAKFVFTSNRMASISSDRADRRRVVFSDISPVVGELDAKYQERLDSEIPLIANWCRDKYEAINQKGFIMMPEDTLEEIEDRDNETFREYSNKYFDIIDMRKVPPAPMNSLPYAKGWQLELHAANVGMKEGIVNKYLKWLRDNYGIKSRKVTLSCTKEGHVKDTRYVGISFKTGVSEMSGPTRMF